MVRSRPRTPHARVDGIGRALATKPTYHVVVLTSTVLPGVTRRELLPILERESGKRRRPGLRALLQPRSSSRRHAIREFLNPDFTLVGELDPRSGDYLEAYYAEVMANSPSCMRMSLENAELTKISINSYVTMKITFANMLAALCEHLPGGDVDVVTGAVGADRRVGDRYLKGGLGYGGPCFPRDNVALGFFARQVGEQAPLPAEHRRTHARIPQRLADRVSSLAPPGSTIAILGLAHEPRSRVTEQSQSVALARLLHERGHDGDGLRSARARASRRRGLHLVDNVDVCLQAADLGHRGDPRSASCFRSGIGIARRP